MTDPIEEALTSIETAGSPPGWAHDILAAAYRASRLEVERLSGLAEGFSQYQKEASAKHIEDIDAINALRLEVEALKKENEKDMADWAKVHAEQTETYGRWTTESNASLAASRKEVESLKNDLAIAHRVCEATKAHELEAVRIGCENITAREAAEKTVEELRALKDLDTERISRALDKIRELEAAPRPKDEYEAREWQKRYLDLEAKVKELDAKLHETAKDSGFFVKDLEATIAALMAKVAALEKELAAWKNYPASNRYTAESFATLSRDLGRAREVIVNAAEDLEEGHEASALARLHTAIAAPPSPAEAVERPCDKGCPGPHLCGHTPDSSAGGAR